MCKDENYLKVIIIYYIRLAEAEMLELRILQYEEYQS